MTNLPTSKSQSLSDLERDSLETILHVDGSAIVDRMDLGSAEVILSLNPKTNARELIVITSSGRAAIIPADIFVGC